MGKITPKLPNKSEIPKQKRRRRKKDLDDVHSRILKRMSSNEEKCTEDERSKQNPSKNANKQHIRLLHTGIFRNGVKSKNVKKDKNAKKGILYGNKKAYMVAKARLAGDALKLFDGESETICISDSSTQDESTNQLFNKVLVKDDSERTHTMRKSPALVKNQSKKTKCLEDSSKKNKPTEIIFEPIDIPEVVIDYNFDTERTMKGKKKNEEEKEATHLKPNKITSYNRHLHDSYTKLCAKISDEFKNVLSIMEDPLTEARRKLQDYISLPTKHQQREVEESNRESSTSPISEHQACTYSQDAQSLTVQSTKNQNSISCLLESSQQHKKNLNNFTIDRMLSPDLNSWHDESSCFDISILRDNNSKLPLKKRFLLTTPRKKLPTQLDDKKTFTLNCNVPKNIFQKHSEGTDRSGSTNEKFCEADFANMFNNLSTPSIVNQELYRSKEQKIRNELMKIKYSEKFEERDTDLRNDISNREYKFWSRNCARPQAPLEILTAAATFVEAEHLPQTEARNLFTNKSVPISSNERNSFNRQLSPFYCSQNADPSNFNIESAKQKRCANSNVHCCEERYICPNCSNFLHESHGHHQNHAETIQTKVAPGSSCFPIHCSSVASNHVNLPNNMGPTRLLSLIPSRIPYTYQQQVDVDHQRMVCLQNFTQPVKYFALDNGVNVRKIPLYGKDGVCHCQNYGHKSNCLH